MAPAFALASAGEAGRAKPTFAIMDETVQLRKNSLSDWLDKALRKMEQVLTGPVSGMGDRKSMPEALDVKNTKEQEALFLKAIDDHHGIIDKICRSDSNSHADKEDLYQEIAYQLWKAYPSFTGDSKISSWIYRIALRSAIMPFRARPPTSRCNIAQKKGSTTEYTLVADNPKWRSMVSVMAVFYPQPRSFLLGLL
jgi:hypothetical protein